MSILNDLDQKITAIGKTAVEKTKNLTDSARTSGEIEVEERKIKEHYAKIGRLFVQQNPQECQTAEYEGLYRQALASEERLRVMSQNTGQGTMRCPNCNSQIPQDSVFCNGCGTKISIPQEAELEVTEVVNAPEAQTSSQSKSQCPSCGSEMETGQVFCMECGTKA